MTIKYYVGGSHIHNWEVFKDGALVGTVHSDEECEHFGGYVSCMGEDRDWETR